MVAGLCCAELGAAAKAGSKSWIIIMHLYAKPRESKKQSDIMRLTPSVRK